MSDSEFSIDINELVDSINIEFYKSEFEKLNSEVSSLSISNNNDEYIKKIKNLTKITQIIELYEELAKLNKQKTEAFELLSDLDLKDAAEEEISTLSIQIEKLANQLLKLTQKPLKNDQYKAILEIRPGVGGVEANLFAEVLHRMYIRYCTNNNLTVEQISLEYDEVSGIKESIFLVNSPESFSMLRFESGVHRVQRIPVTESAGRIHTSTASVVVMPQFENISIQINPDDLRIEVYRSSGPGGQSVNTTDSAVRITHIPSKITVTCQNGKSQHKNKEMAMAILASKLEEIEQEKRDSQEKNIRNSSIQGGDRSVKIRTYNYQQSRVTDHRIHKTWHNLEQIVNGEIDEVVDTVNVLMRKEIAEEEMKSQD